MADPPSLDEDRRDVNSSTNSSARKNEKEDKDDVGLEDANQEHCEHEDRQKSRWDRLWISLFDDWWMWEIGGMLWGIVLLLAVCILLKEYDNRPQSDWRGAVTINTAVSLLTTVAKLGFTAANTAALGQLRWNWYSKPRPLSDWVTFDTASRGSPWGSVQLLLKLHVRHLASIGAFVSLAGIFFASLTQQAITFRSTVSPTDSGTAKLPRSYGYNTAVNPFEIQQSNRNFVSPTDTNMLAAVAFISYNGSSGVVPGFALSTTCSTGTCTFEIQSTLGACSDCVPLNDQIQSTCSDGSCSYTYSNATRPTLMTGSLLQSDAGNAIYTALNVTSEVDYAQDYSIFGFTTLYTNYTQYLNYTQGGYNLTAGTTAAMRCTISVCVKTFNSSVTNGTFQENIINTTPITPGDYPIINGVSQIPMPAGGIPSNGTLSISLGSLKTVGQSLRQLFIGSAVIGPGVSRLSVANGVEINNIQYGFGYTSPVLQSMYNNNTVNISLTAENIATTITNIIRQHDNPVNFVQGIAYTTTSYMRVRWLWIIYPAGLEFIILVFLVATILKTSRSGVQNVWKSNPLTLLFHGLENRGEALENVSEIRELHAMTSLSKKLRVKLRRDGPKTTLVDARNEDSDDDSNGDEEQQGDSNER